MSQLALQSGAERTALVDETAARLGVLPVIVEKDFWVCWLLARVFAAPTLGEVLRVLRDAEQKINGGLG